MSGSKRVTSVLNIIKWLCVAFTAITLFIRHTPVANMLARPLVVKETLKKADIIIVLGGGAFKNGVLAVASNERLIRGLILYKEGWAPRIIFTGGSITSGAKKIVHTVIKSPDKGAIDVSEGVLMGEIALRLGVPEDDVVIDPSSANTYENLAHARKYMGEKGLKTCIIVTSSIHMTRAALIAQKLGLKYYLAPVKDYSDYRVGGIGRLSLFHEALWEYTAIALYRLYGYI